MYRARRTAEDEGDLRRALNADRRRRFGSRNRMLALLCECGDSRCHRTVVLSVEDYDGRRPGAIVHSEHAARVRTSLAG